MEHVWIETWLTDELEGYKCGNCGKECLDPKEVLDIPCVKSKPKNKKKSVIMESRYTGNLPFPSWRKWHKCGVYATMKSAEMALATKNRLQLGNFEYRIKGDS